MRWFKTILNYILLFIMCFPPTYLIIIFLGISRAICLELWGFIKSLYINRPKSFY
jgi:hypothetical protein